MAYPSLTSYQVAIQNPPISFRDAELQQGKAETTPLGLPRALAGGFALTYHMKRTGGDWAVRCFRSESGDRHQRYAAITGYLSSHKAIGIETFEFQREGILVEGRRYPIVKMTWVNGVTLGSYLGRYAHDASKVQRLLDQFVAIVHNLEQLGIAHGDLQHGNIMVSKGRLALVDYDGMYVPGMSMSHSDELGDVNYQSPLRDGTTFGPYIDRFSAIVIALTLQALIKMPTLWDKYGVDPGKLLFERSDYIDPERSELVNDLKNDPSFVQAASQLELFCRVPLANLPTLDDFLAGNRLAHAAQTVSLGANVRRQQFDVLPGDGYQQLLGRVGDVVQVVGQVFDIRIDTTRYGRPYAFINFGDWQRGTFRLVLWEKSIKLMEAQNQSLHDFDGKWLSVTGLVEEYKNLKTHRRTPQIVIGEPREIRFLSGKEEADTLTVGGGKAIGGTDTRGVGTATVSPPRQNDRVRRNIVSPPSSASLPARPSPTPVIPSRISPQTPRGNADIRRNLAKLGALSTPPARAPPVRPPTRYASSGPQRMSPLPPTFAAPGPVWHPPPVSPPIPSSKNARIWKVVLVVGGVSLVLAMVLSGIFHSSDASTPRPGVSLPQPTVQFQAPAPGAPIPVSTITNSQIPPAISTSLAALPTASRVANAPTYRPLDGSWVAAAPSMSIRFFAMAWWVPQPDASGTDHFSLGLADGNAGFESFDLYRYRDREGSDQPAAWQSEFQANVAFSSGDAPVVTRQPLPQRAGQNQGQLGQYHYVEPATGRQVDVTLWVGQVGLDRVVMVFRGTPERDAQIDQAVMQVLATIDFDARQ